MSDQHLDAGQRRKHLMASFQQTLARVEPATLLRPHLPGRPPSLIVAVGKAALPMLLAAREAYPGVRWIATPPEEQAERSGELGLAADGNGELLPGSHPLPSELSVLAGETVLARAAALEERARLLLLLSGGGSSLLAAPNGVTLGEKRAVVNDLMRAGADIHQLNAVRKHLSRIKGGRLAVATRARILNLIVSDVPGDDLDTVASGPTVPDETTYLGALRVLDEFGLAAPAVRRHLERGVQGEEPESPGPSNPAWQRVESRVIGSNRSLLETAKGYWESAGYQAIVLSDRFQGEARSVARALAGVVLELRSGEPSRVGRIEELTGSAAGRESVAALHKLVPDGRPVVLLSGGEATVRVTGSGRGGRNQEFALWLLKYLGPRGVWAISAGSDGIDGNSPAAGAVLSPDSWQRAERMGLDVDAYLGRNDSYEFFRALGDSVVTGQTGNNLNDYRAVVVGRLGGRL